MNNMELKLDWCFKDLLKTLFKYRNGRVTKVLIGLKSDMNKEQNLNETFQCIFIMSCTYLQYVCKYSAKTLQNICYNWRFVNFWLEIWSHNWRFFITYLMHVFIVNWCFLFVCFSIEPTASHFNIHCLHFCLSSVSYDEWRIKTVFIIYS